MVKVFNVNAIHVFSLSFTALSILNSIYICILIFLSLSIPPVTDSTSRILATLDYSSLPSLLNNFLDFTPWFSPSLPFSFLFVCLNLYHISETISHVGEIHSKSVRIAVSLCSLITFVYTSSLLLIILFFRVSDCVKNASQYTFPPSSSVFELAIF